MEIIQEIGSYAGFAAVLGLAVLSALYFSQARDVKRLREWAGRAPERGPSPSVPAEPRGVVAQPIARPASRPVPGGTPPPVPRPPGARPATPGAAAAASAAGAAPAIARGPAPATPAAAGATSDDDLAEDQDLEGQELGEDQEQDVTAMDTIVHPPPSPLDDDEQDGDGEDGAVGATGEADEGFDDEPEDDAGDEQATGDEPAVDDETGAHDAFDAEETAVYRPDDADESAEPAEDELGTGEWRPEDEHSDIEFTDEHDIVPATPAASSPRPPTPPPPYQRRGAAGPATGYARDRDPILPQYADSRPDSEGASPAGGGRRPVLLIVAVVVAIAVVAFGVLQLTGGDDSSGGGNEAGLATSGGDGDGGGSSAGGSEPKVDPSQVTVAVLNGTTVPGLAATVGDKVAGEGFQLGTVTNNFDQEKAESVVLYAPGAEDEAADVGRRLDISQREAIDAESQALAGDATVVVVAGADQNQ